MRAGMVHRWSECNHSHMDWVVLEPSYRGKPCCGDASIQWDRSYNALSLSSSQGTVGVLAAEVAQTRMGTALATDYGSSEGLSGAVLIDRSGYVLATSHLGNTQCSPSTTQSVRVLTLLNRRFVVASTAAFNN